MSPEALLVELERRGAQLGVEDDALRVRAPRGALDAGLRAGIQLHKPALMRLLRGPRGAPATPVQRDLFAAWQQAPEDPSYNVALLVQARGALDVRALEQALSALVRRHDALRARLEPAGEGVELRALAPWPITLEAEPTEDPQAWLHAQLERPFDLHQGPLFRASLARSGEAHALALVTHHAVCDGWSLRVLLGELEPLYAAALEGQPPTLPPPPSFLEALRRAPEDAPPAPTAWAQVPPDGPLAGEGRRLSRVLPVGLAQGLERLAAEEGTTLFSALLAGVGLVLSRWTGAETVGLVVPQARRDAPERAQLVGMLTDPVAVQLELGEASTLRALLRRAHADALRQLGAARGLGAGAGPRPPQVLLNYLALAPLTLRMPGLQVEVDERLPGARLELTLYVHRDPLRMTAVWRAERFTPERVEALLSQVQSALQQMVRDPGQDPRRLRLAEPERLHLPTEAWPLRWPSGAGGVEQADGRRSWDEVMAAAARLASELEPGQTLALLAQRSAAMVAATLGALRAGACLSLLDPAWPAARLEAAARQADGVLRLPGVDLTEALAALPLRAELRWQAPAAWPADCSADAGTLLWTSGTTGAAKGIRSGAAPLVNYLRWVSRTFPLGPDDRVAMCSGLGHDPILRDMLLPAWLGATACVPPREPRLMGAELGPWLAAARVSVLHLTPSLGRLIVASGAPLPDLRFAFFGGEVLRPADVAALRALAPQVRVVNLYGATETPQGVAAHEVHGTPWEVPVGAGIDGVELLVLGPAGPAAVGEVGEIVVRSAFLAQGYVGAEQGAARFADDPQPGVRRFHTGDLGWRGPDGAVRILGRRDRCVKLRGHRVELDGVASTLRAAPGVLDAHVALRGERLVAWVVGQTEGLERWARERLPQEAVPSAWVSLSALPLASNGKVDGHRLPAPEGARGRSASSELERQIVRVFGELLGQEDVPADVDFFALGGHSLLAVRACQRLGQRLGLEVDVRLVFESPSAAALARRLAHLPPSTPLPRVDRRQPLLASFAQRRLAVLESLEGRDYVPTARRRWRLRGALDREALDRALVLLEARHEGLRTRLVLRGDEVLQEIDPPRVSVLDDPRPLSLSEGPAWSCGLRSEAGERVLELTFAHGACDGRSLSIAATELGQLYRAALGEPLSPLPAQMADFAAWQRAAAGAAWAEDLAWWVDALRGLPHLELPLRGARPPRKGRTGALHQRALPPALAEEVRRSERSAFVLTLAALTATLARYTGQRDLAIGVPVGARPHADAEPLIGMFLNPVVLRQRFDGDPSLGALLQAAQATTTAALARAQVPFEAVLDALRPERDLSLTPLYQVSLNHLDLSEARLNLPGVEAEPLPRPTPAAHADLSVHLVTEGEALTLAVVRDVELLEAEQAEALLQHLQEALEALLRAPDTALSALALSAPTLPPPPGLPGALPWRDAQTLSERLHEVSLAHPEGLAVLAEGQRWTWGRLAAQVEAVASALEAHPGRHVGLLLGRDGWMVAGLLGTLAAGRVAVLIDPAFPAGRRAFIEQDAEVELLLTTAALDPGVGPPRLHVEALAPQPPRLRTPDPDALAYILYTSGSTGRPKGVMQNQRSALLHARTYAERLGLGPEDRLSLASTYAFDAGLMDIFGAVCAGAALCPLTLGAELDRAPTQLAALGVSVFHATPTLFRHVARCADPAPLDRVRVVVLGGEEALATDHDALRARFSPDCALINGLGPTESTLALQHLVTQRPARASLPVGGPVGGARVRLETPLGPQPALFGVGELVLESPRVALGYWRRPEETAAAFQDAPRRYRTGDLARILPGGVLEFAGRGDRQVEVRGHRVELGEIEARVLARGASEVAVTSGLSGLVAWVVGAPDLEALRAGLREELPSWMRPRLIALDALPRTPTGKLDRRALHERRPEPAPAASGALARRVAEVFAELLSLPAVGPEDDFFELGGHSLLAVQAARRLSLALEQEVSLAALFECATPARLAERLGSRAAPLQPTVIRRGALPVVVFGPLGARREAGLWQLAEVLQRPALLVEASPDAPSLSALAERVLAELPPMSAAVGWSNGGLLAFEVARQAGVPALLLDSPAPTAPPAPGLAGFAAQLLGDSRLEVGSLEALLERALADERVPARTSLQELEGMMAAYAQARSPVRALLRGWAPRPLRTPLVYLRARDTRWRVDPLPAWAALAEGGWRVEALPGEHFALRDPAQARAWGARVLEALGPAEHG